MMKSLLVIFALAVFSFINVTNGQCTTEKGEACKKGYTDANTNTTANKCTAAYTYGKCLIDEMCYNDNTQKTTFNETFNPALKCGSGDPKCTVTTGLACFTNLCSNKTKLKNCLDDANCYVESFKTAHDGYDSTCSNGCGTVAVSVLMMFLSTLLMFIKN